jgi:Ca-activated chloride channel family protein
MSFIWIEILWLLLLIPLLVMAYIIVQRRRQKYALRYASLSLVRDAAGRGPGMRRHIPAILFLISLAILIFAVARPAAIITLPSQQGTVILTIDVSGSMRAEDLKPSRLEAAKAAALAFIEKQPENVRIGIVSFSDSAALVQAPTIDRESTVAAVNRLVPQRGTAVGRGILTSLDSILEELGEKSGEAQKDPLSLSPQVTTPPPSVSPGTYAPAIIVLLSDGQSNVGPPPLDIIGQAANRGVRVYTVGVGSPDGTILNIMGRSIRVRLDEETLKSIAEKSDAEYFRADNESDLLGIYEKLSMRIVFQPEQTELTALFAAMASLLLITGGILSLRWFNRLP